MKALLRLGTTLGLIGATAIGTLLGTMGQAFALPTEEVVKMLSPVPIFAVLTPNNEPAPICQSQVDESGVCPNNQLIFTFFIDPRDAENTLKSQINLVKDENIKKQLSTLKIGPIPLGSVYKYLLDNKDKKDAPKIAVIPNQEQVKEANAMSGKNKQDAPVFLICYQDKKDSCEQPIFGSQIIPLFFEKSVAKQFLENVEKNNSESKGKLRIEVTDLFSVFAQLSESNEQELKKVRFLLSDSTNELLKKYSEANTAQQTKSK